MMKLLFSSVTLVRKPPSEEIKNNGYLNRKPEFNTAFKAVKDSFQKVKPELDRLAGENNIRVLVTPFLRTDAKETLDDGTTRLTCFFNFQGQKFYTHVSPGNWNAAAETFTSTPDDDDHKQWLDSNIHELFTKAANAVLNSKSN